jgi:rubrerythrin
MNPFTKDNIRNWLFQLHNQVNERTGKNNKFIIEQLSELYDKPFCFTDYIKIIIQQMIQSIKLGWSSRNDIQKTIRILEEMKRFYDFF